MYKVVLITGASRGIGAACAIVFAKNGYNIIINYLNSEKQAVSLKENIINNYNVKCDIFKCDISKEEEVLKMLEFVKTKYKQIDVLINNAAISNDMFIEDKKTIDFKNVIDVNLIGTYIVTKTFAKMMNNGSIINISSTNGIDTYYPESIDYDASKAGIISLTHNFAKYYAPNIRVNAICPGWVETDQNALLDDLQRKEIKDKILLKRFGIPTEIAKVIYFIAVEASYVNNSIIRVDGGELC
ncbi:MAG: SDR family NAD(P)-dependent oxidoreductase [Bacilli bacterium]